MRVLLWHKIGQVSFGAVNILGICIFNFSSINLKHCVRYVLMIILLLSNVYIRSNDFNVGLFQVVCFLFNHFCCMINHHSRVH